MALPLIAAGIAARAAAKKLASRAAGGITGKGAKQVNPMYKNMDKQVTPLSKNAKINKKINKTEAKANARGLKAANKTKSGNIKLDRDRSNLDAYMKASEQYRLKTGDGRIISGTANNLKYTPPARPNRIRGGSMKSKLNFPKGM